MASVAARRLADTGGNGVRVAERRYPWFAAVRASRAQVRRGLLADQAAPLVGVAGAQQPLERDVDEARIAVPRLAVGERELRALDDGVDELSSHTVEQAHVEAVEERQLLEEDRPLTPRAGLGDAPAVVVELDGRLERRLPGSEVVAGEERAVPPARAVHRLGVLEVRGDRLRDKPAVEGVACLLDLSLAVASAGLVEHAEVGRGEVAVAEEPARLGNG